MDKVCNPVSIVLEMHGEKYSIEGMPWDSGADELLDAFKRLMVCATFSPTILNDECGHYEYVSDI